MRTISLWLFTFGLVVFASGVARAQDAATQQQIDQINGRIQDIYGVLDKQDKRIAALEKSVGDLQNKLNQPAANNFASADDLKKLAEQVQEIDKKRQDDNEQILKALEKLDKAMSVLPPNRKAAPAAAADNSTPNAGGKQNGYYYEVKSGNTLSAIVKAYADQNIKVTVKQILDANPGLDPKNLPVGKKIFIPQPQ
jgi:septal ring factor EnvC (AmiA/AmiB activator)